jgi:hypothetical protein
MRGVEHMGTTHFLVPLLASTLQLLPAKPAVQHVTLAPSASGNGGKLILQLDVTPKAKIHVYGPGAKDFLQPSLKITGPAGPILGKPSLPPPELVLDPILEERIPMYTKTFRVTQPLTLAAVPKPGEHVTITGVFAYQACDDKVCYAPSSAPVSWLVVGR